MKTTCKALVIAAAMVMGTGCVDSDPTLLANAHIFGTCDSTGGFESATLEGEFTFAGQLSIDLATISEGGRGQTVAFQEVTTVNPDTMEPETSVEPVGTTGSMNINFAAQNQLIPTTEYTSVGYDSELRVDQNQFRLETVEFEVTDSPAPYTLNDVAYNGLTSTGGDLWLAGVPMLGPQQVAQWSEITTAVAGNNSIVPVTVETKLVGSLVDGTSAESNVVRLEMLVCNGCGIQTTGLCVLEE